MFAHEREAMVQLGHHITDNIYDGMRIFPSSMVATVMLSSDNAGISLDRLVRQVEWLKREIVYRGGTVHWISGKDLNAFSR